MRQSPGWTKNIECSTCHGADWVVRNGVWTCTCGKPMTSAQVAAYHKTLCNCAAKDRAVVGNMCQTCRKPMT